MKRAEYIQEMIVKANELVENYSYDKNRELWEMAYDWNANHDESEEIFMSELWKEDGYDNDGFAIEDDCWYFKD